MKMFLFIALYVLGLYAFGWTCFCVYETVMCNSAIFGATVAIIVMAVVFWDCCLHDCLA